MISRRTLLEGALGATGLALVGCGDDDPTGPDGGSPTDSGSPSDSSPGGDSGTMEDAGSPDTTLHISTTSTSPAWSPAEVLNDGESLLWQLTGDVDADEQSTDTPVFDLSTNTGTAVITALSTTGFLGLDKLKVGGSEVTELSISAAQSLTVIRANDNQLAALELRFNPALRWLYLADNAMPSAVLDGIIAALDANGETDGVLEIAGNAGALTEASYDGYLSLIEKRWTIDVGRPARPGGRTTDAPVLSGFHVRDGEPSRVYFDSSKAITGADASGFAVAGAAIASLTVSAGATTGHYFTLSSPFTYWDNNAIRYEGGSDLSDGDGRELKDFTLEHIANRITIAEGSAKTIYVDAGAAASGDGTTEARAFRTLQEGIDALPSGGGKVWVKAGDYGNEVLRGEPFLSDPTRPNVIEGYRTAPGDITSLYYEYVPRSNVALDPAQMPLFRGGNRETPVFWDIQANSYYIIRNIQAEGYGRGIRVLASSGMECERVILKSIGNEHSDGIAFAWQHNSDNDSHNARFKSCVAINSSLDGFVVYGNHPLVEDCAVYCNEALDRSDAELTTDYYFALKGSNGIVKDCVAYKDTPDGDGHNGHGFSLKTKDSTAAFVVEHNLVEGCTAIGIQNSFQTRHAGCRFNVFKDSEAHSNIPNRKVAGANFEATGGIDFVSGGTGNIFERMSIHDADVGISFEANAEADRDANIQHDALIRNCVFYRLGHLFMGDSTQPGTSTPTGNKVENCTFHDIGYLAWVPARSRPVTFNDTEITNCIVSEVRAYDRDVATTGLVFTNNSFFAGIPPRGTGAIEADPMFRDVTAEPDPDFHLTTALTDGGLDLDRVPYDKDRVERIPGSYSFGAYESD